MGSPEADRFADNMTDSPTWNESVWFSFSRPEVRMHGCFYYYFRPNMGMLNGGPMMWDPSGLEMYSCLYQNWRHLQPMPSGAGPEKFEVKLPNSLEVHVIEPVSKYKIDYDDDGFRADLTWEAIAPLHELRTRTAELEATNKYHFEQSGRMKGTIRNRGEVYPIDCFSMRDGSSGPRDFSNLGSGGYYWGIAADSSFHAMSLGEGREQKLIGGFLYKDGEMASIVSGTRRILEYGKYAPTRFELDAVDAKGRTLRATAKVDDGLIFNGWPAIVTAWGLTEWDWDGVHHLGDNQEFYLNSRFRELARGEAVLA